MNPGSSSIPNPSEVPSAAYTTQPETNSIFPHRLIAPVLKYVEGRTLLFGLEFREAWQEGIAILVWLIVGALAVFSGWLLLATALVGWLTKFFACSWVVAAFITGSAHILIALIAVVVAWKLLMKASWFADSLNELKKDRIWLKTQTPKN